MITPAMIQAEQMLAKAQTKGERIEIASSLLAVSLDRSKGAKLLSEWKA